MTAWFTMMGELTKPPSPWKLHRVELSLNDLAVNVPDFRKKPDVGLIAGTTSAMKVPSCAPVVALTEMPLAGSQGLDEIHSLLQTMAAAASIASYTSLRSLLVTQYGGST